LFFGGLILGFGDLSLRSYTIGEFAMADIYTTRK